MFATLKVLLITIYLLALARLAGMLPGSGSLILIVAGALLVAHLLETIFMFKYVRLYPGSLTVSVFLTLLFGLLHWKLLADQAKREKI